MIAPPDRIIPTQAAPTVATYTISSDGDALGPELTLLSIVVDREINRIPSATLIIRDGKVSEQSFRVSESEDFAPGKKIQIDLGYRAENSPVFSGEVVSQKIKIRDQRSLLIVTVKDPAYKLTLGTKTRYFTDQTDSDAWESIISDAGLSTDGETTGEVVPELTQYRSTDWDFIMSRLETNGLVCTVSDGTMNITKPEVGPTAALNLEFGANLLSFDAETDGRDYFAEAQTHAWSPTDQEAITESSPPATGGAEEIHERGPLEAFHGGGVAPAELNTWAASLSMRSQLARVRATAEFQGTHEVNVGDTVKLAGLGERFNGLAYVSALRHEVADGQWRTIAQLGIAPEWFTERYAISAQPAGGLLPAVSGLQIATVVQIHDDPAGEERILVITPAMQPVGEGNWARLATPVAGAEAGMVFRPAVGEEVVLGFLDDDPRYPIILAGLHGSSNPAPLPPVEDNDQMGYVSRKGNKFVVNDTEQSVVLETEAGDTLSLLGKDGSIEIKDQNGNTITLSSSGIEISSASDLTLKASGSVKIDGTSVEVKSSATGKFEAGATLTLKGSLVQLN